jgi:hypothetical protein
MKYNHEVYIVIQLVGGKTSSKKTDVTSFRLEKETLAELHKIAERDKVSLNTLASQIFDQYLNWNSTAPQAGLIPQPKHLLIKIFEKLTNDEIIEIANHVAETQVKSLMLATRKEYTIGALMKGIEYWTKASNFPSSHVEKSGGIHQYIIQHEMGKKWSLYYKQVFGKTFEQLGVKSPKIDTTDHTLVMTITLC